LLIASFLCPTELSVYVGSARLPPHRALLLLLIPLAIWRLVGAKAFRVATFDVLFLFFGMWTVFVYIYHHGQADGLQTGAALAIDSFGSFIVARAYVRSEAAFEATAASLFGAVVVAGLMALPEMLGGQIFLHDFLAKVTGYVHPVAVEKRGGLTRAFGPFDHPIHLGTFCASGLALAAYAARRERAAITRSLFVAACAMTSVSSAPMLSLGVQVALMAFDKATRGIKGRVAIAFAVIAGAFGALSLVATRSPFALIATGLTLDPWTGYYRLMIWEHGLENVWSHPLTGLGLNDWDRPLWMVSSTIDAFWLVIAIRGGLPAFLLLVLGIAFLMFGATRRMRRASPALKRMGHGWVISLMALMLLGCTVHYWNVPFAYFFFFLGLGGCLADPVRSAASVKARPVAAPTPRRVRWVMPEGEAMVAGRHAAAGRWPVPVPVGLVKAG
jgi:hypothetical protein